MSVIVVDVKLSKNNVKTNEQFQISISVKETVSEPKTYRLPFVLGQNKGGIK